MTLLFPATVLLDGERCAYTVYEFKLTPGKFKAELTSSSVKFPIKEIIFWKGKQGWETSLKSKKAKSLVEILGHDIDDLKN